MEIKYTIEILTKDIQDIEKLVGNLGNSKEASAIELDLALSKLRNVYEILTMIQADRLHELIRDQTVEEESSPEPKAEPEPEPEPNFAPEPESEFVLEPEQATEPEPVSESEPKPGPEQVPEPEPEPAPEPAPEPVPKVDTSTETADHTILAEKFSTESSINENMAGKLGNDSDAKLVGQPIDNISRNIGINDRFLIIRELFAGDSDRFTSLVNELDRAEGYQAADGLLKQQFEGNMDHQGVVILASLLKRRYIR
jgi:hypothetical protein